MIKFENTEVLGWEAAIRGMRNPMNSWHKSDSYPAINCGACGRIEREGMCKKEGRDCTGYEWGQRTNSFEWTMEWFKQPAEGD